MSAMIRRIYQALAIGLCCLPLPVVPAEQDDDVAARALAVFSAKCAGCHGPKLARPRGRFGYVLDLARVAANREMVVPSSPSESELWQLVHRSEMPPADAPAGSLSDGEKEAIRAWIAAGAPSATAAAAPTEAEVGPSRPTHSLRATLFRWLGPLHLIILHFPIALLIAAATTEFWRALRGGRGPTREVRYCVMLAAASAVITASLGWIHAANGYGTGAPRLLIMHRWIGTAAAVMAVAAAAFSEWDERRGVRSMWFRAWLFAASLLVAIEGHFGGMLVHGDDFLSNG